MVRSRVAALGKHQQYSWLSRRRGDFALIQLPEAQLPLAPRPFYKMISPMGKNFNPVRI